MKQSSIEWFFDELKRLNVTVPSESAVELSEIYKKAQDIHKDDIENAYLQGYAECDSYGVMCVDEYYEKTFKSE